MHPFPVLLVDIFSSTAMCHFQLLFLVRTLSAGRALSLWSSLHLLGMPGKRCDWIKATIRRFLAPLVQNDLNMTTNNSSYNLLSAFKSTQIAQF